MTGVSPRWEDARQPLCLDIGCGAARNAMGLAELGYRVVGTDLSSPMLEAAQRRVRAAPAPLAVDLTLAPMAPLPFGDAVFDLVVAHGIWNLAHSGAEFRAAVSEAARVARAGAGLFLFTFSRHTLPGDARPDSGESFVFSSWNGEPQCFLTEGEVVDEVARAGFVRDAPLTEYNSPRPGEIRTGGPPVIYDGRFAPAGTTGQHHAPALMGILAFAVVHGCLVSFIIRTIVCCVMRSSSRTDEASLFAALFVS